jgi:5-methylcytosine-specific restriction endonuclease McrA
VSEWVPEGSLPADVVSGVGRKSLGWRARLRDKGVCADCGLDTFALEKRLRRVWRRERENRGRIRALRDALETFGIRGFKLHEYDHIVPLWEGGPDVLENIQTLCLECHREKTALEAGRRAHLRRREMKREGRRDGQIAKG